MRRASNAKRGDVKGENILQFVLMMLTGHLGTGSQQLAEVYMFWFRLTSNGVQASDFQQLIDQTVKPIQFDFHCLIKFLLILLAELTHDKRVQIKPKSGDWSLQFVSHTIDKVRLPAIELNFFDRQKGIKCNSK